MRVRAERPAAVGDDLAVGGQLRQPILELVDRDRARAVDVAGRVFLGWPDVDENDVALVQSLDELIAADPVDVRAEIVARGAWASRSSSSSRRGLAKALPITAIASKSGVFPSLELIR